MITYKEIGEKNLPCLVFIHGYALDETAWDETATALADSYYSLCIRLPMTIGETKAITEQSVEDHIHQAILRLMESKRISKAHIVGHSMGGYLALAFAEAFPHKTHKVSLINSTCFADTNTKKETRKNIIAHIEQYGKKSFLMQGIPSWFSQDFKERSHADVLALIDRAMRIDAEMLILYQRYMMERKDRSSFLEKNKRMLGGILLGELDQLISAGDFERLNLPPGAIVTLPKVAHMSMLEAPALTADYVRKFSSSDK